MATKKKPGEVKRRLHLVTPGEKRGADVTALQRAINRKFDHFKIDRRIAVDGEYGRQTAGAARQIGLLMGAAGQNWKSLKRGTVTKSVQNLIRGKREKTRVEKRKTVLRKPWRRNLRKRYDKSAGEKVLDWCLKQVGTTENPSGANSDKGNGAFGSGPKIDQWILFTGYTFPVYWCGCFACYAVVKIGGAKIPNRIRLGYDGYIVDDARNGRNGLVEVPFSEARAGDIVVYTFPHIGVVDRVAGDTLHTIEGNTSSGSSGSQSNGGGVFARERSRSEVRLIARPNY